jgi:hypothetical protein
MRTRLRGATLVAMAVAAIVMLAGCGGRSAAQKAYLVAKSSSLGRCTIGGGGGDFGAPFDPTRAESWNGSKVSRESWARVLAWRVTSKAKDPPGDYTVDVNARFEFSRGDRSVLLPTVGAHEPGAKSIAKAIDAGLDVFVRVHASRNGPYASSALVFDNAGRFAWVGNCASRSSNAAASAFERAGVDPKVVAPAIRRWIADGDTDALLRAFTRK